MHAGPAKVHRTLVKAQEHMRSTMVEVADLVDLVLDSKGISEKGRQWIAGINDLHRHGLMPWMPIEVAADQIEVTGPAVERVRGGMNTEEPSTRSHNIEKSCFFNAAHRKFAGGVEHHRGVALEIFGRKF